MTEEQKELALDLAAQGLALPKIRAAIGLDQTTFLNFRRANVEFERLFQQARQEGLEEQADSLLTVHDDLDDIQKAQLKSSNLKWLLSKRRPQIYGDRVDLNVTHAVDLTAALTDARNRAHQLTQEKVVQAIDITQYSTNQTTDTQSVVTTKDADTNTGEDESTT